MFTSKKPSLNEWKNWAIGLVGNTMSSIDQATSRWFLNLINGLPRDYFAKTFDQVNYLDKRVWEGMFRANIEEIKEQLELGVSESIVEANLVKLQGLVGKYSLSPVIYENGLKELEVFISNLSNAGNYLKVLKGIRSEFREELKSQPALLKECIEGEANLGRKEGEYYKSLLDDRSLKNASPKRVISESPILDKATVSKRGNSNSKLRNISKLLFSNPGQALTLFLAAQSAFASAANIQMSNSTGLAIGNDTLSFDNNLSNLSEFEGRINENVSIHSVSKSSNFKNSNKVRKEIEVVERDVDGRFTEIRDEFKDLRDTGDPLEVLTYIKSQRFKRSANDSPSEMETVPENKEETILVLDKRVEELNKEIERLKNSSSVEGYKDTIASLEGQKMILKRSFDDMKRQSNQTLSQRDGEIAGLKVIVGNLEEQVKNLKKKIEEDGQKHLPDECVGDIEARRFEAAKEKLKLIDGRDKIGYIVNRVYAGKISNFPLLFEFGNSITSGILHDMQQKVKYSFDSFKESTKNLAVEKLKQAMLDRRYKSSEVILISNEVHSLDSSLFESLIKEVVSDVYGRITGGEILDYLKGHSHVEQDIIAYNAFFDVIEHKGYLNDTVLTELAYYLKEAIESDAYHKVSSEIMRRSQDLKNRLPGLVRTLAFSSNVCIKNVRDSESLCADSAHYTTNTFFFTREENLRKVFTSVPSIQVTQDKWRVQHRDKGFSIMNTVYNQYLTSWYLGVGIADAILLWKFSYTTAGFHILRKVREDGGYVDYALCAESDDNKYDKYKRNLMILMADSISENKTPCLWKIEDCSGKQRKRRDTEDQLQSYSEPSSYLSDIALEKTTGKNSSSISR
ncbi:coiled-coil domain-containing protein [Wolbachia endosymbiont (group B) of Apotomis turbidana]|uniref:hypothetical protein n=1 Tax=Wolbachia endosymbiont (group B) of Apotomis turbidana TaxID=2953983 RepID=UPI00222ECE0F|nr:hypothetical protein [Wolbachia endosymbiont (group B) of Apotomis turbidana]